MSRIAGQTVDLNPLTLHEYQALMAVLPHPWPLFFRILWETGIRKSEALALKRKDIGGGTLAVRRLKKRREQIDQIPITPILTAALLDRAQRVHTELLFPYDPSAPFKALRRAAVKAGIRTTMHPHLFRHAFGARMASEDMDLAPLDQVSVLAKMLGHANIRPTLRYFQPGQEKVDEAWGRMIGHGARK